MASELSVLLAGHRPCPHALLITMKRPATRFRTVRRGKAEPPRWRIGTGHFREVPGIAWLPVYPSLSCRSPRRSLTYVRIERLTARRPRQLRGLEPRENPQ